MHTPPSKACGRSPVRRGAHRATRVIVRYARAREIDHDSVLAIRRDGADVVGHHDNASAVNNLNDRSSSIVPKTHSVLIPIK